MLAIQALISAIVLNAVLWLALLVSLPVTGTRPIYVAIVFVGMLAPAGLGVVEASAASLLVAFGLTRGVVTLGVLGWRLVNFWLPIPLGGAAYLSLDAEHRRNRPGRVERPRAHPSPAPAAGADGGRGSAA